MSEGLFGDLQVTKSSEAVDGSSAYIEGIVRPLGVCEIRAGIDLTMPSGRAYRVFQLTWQGYDGWGYPVRIDLEPTRGEVLTTP